MRTPLASVPGPRTAPTAHDRQARAPRTEPPLITAVCLDIDDTLIDFTGSARKALRLLIGRDDMWGTWQRITDEHHARVVAGEFDYDLLILFRLNRCKSAGSRFRCAYYYQSIHLAGTYNRQRHRYLHK